MQNASDLNDLNIYTGQRDVANNMWTGPKVIKLNNVQNPIYLWYATSMIILTYKKCVLFLSNQYIDKISSYTSVEVYVWELRNVYLCTAGLNGVVLIGLKRAWYSCFFQLFFLIEVYSVYAPLIGKEDVMLPARVFVILFSHQNVVF